MSLLIAEDISVNDGPTELLSPVSLRLEPGEPLIVLGETGSGKSLLAQAIMGTLPPELSASGRITVADHSLNAAAPEAFRKLWGRRIAVLPQEPWLSLDPLMRSRQQVEDAHRLVRGSVSREARQQAEEDLSVLGLSAAGKRYPHQLSGGMAQRVAIAAARAGGAAIVIADEPTKGLDAALREEVAKLLLTGTGPDHGLLLITHDLALARRIGGRLMIMRAGQVVETGNTEQVFCAPQSAYTRELLAADPETWLPRKSSSCGSAVVSAEGLSIERGGQALFRDVTVEIAPGGVFGVTGPSGCGKSSLGDAMLGLVRPSAGLIRRLPGLDPHAFQKLYQDPVASFPRKRKLGQTLGDAARLAGILPATIEALLDRLGLVPALLQRRPDAVSGGELQRLSLLRVLLMRPAFIFADEPTSRLDPITQASVIDLLTETVEQENVALMLVSHDAALIRNTADATLSLH